jgi:uncharacterized membrane protein YoaK (UPF0700 family)
MVKFWINSLQILCFLVGATTSSFMVGAHRRFLGGRQYSPVLALMGFVVLIAALIPLHEVPACLVITFVAGMQNAMSTFYSGAIVRTTHVTGTLTDIGIEIAKLAKGKGEGWWKIQVLTCFFVSFFLGGMLGTLATAISTTKAFLFPASVYLFLAIGNWLYHEQWWNSKVVVSPKVTAEATAVQPKTVDSKNTIDSLV